MTDEQTLARSTPEEQGVSSNAIQTFLDAIERENLELHRFMLLRHGFVISEGCWSPYDAKRPHMLFSLTKSFTSTAIGLGVAEGLLTVNDPVVSFFPESLSGMIDERLAAMRVKDLLTMSVGHAKPIMGSEWRQTKGDWVRYFFGKPMDHAPGTRFIYNSGATYMLSAIVQKVTGQRVLDYLQPRLFAPLGIQVAEWDTCPSGINTGGWGLSLTTEDLARFGLLYLQRGEWNGKRILPEHWVTDATTSQISNGNNAQSDSQQGYGYQFWRGRHGSYRADGAFGQLCLVVPEQDAVIAIHGALTGMQTLLDLIWTHLLPGMERNALEKDENSHQRLLSNLQHLNIGPTGASTSIPTRAASISGLLYTMEQNVDGVRAVSFVFDGNACIFSLIDYRGEHTVRCGIAGWIEGSTTMTGNELHHQYQPAQMQVAASGVWKDEATFVMTWCFVETPFIDRVVCHFAGKGVTVNRSVNVNSAATERPGIHGNIEDTRIK